MAAHTLNPQMLLKKEFLCILMFLGGQYSGAGRDASSVFRAREAWKLETHLDTPTILRATGSVAVPAASSDTVPVSALIKTAVP